MVLDYILYNKMSSSSSSVPLFEQLRSIFSEIIIQIQQLSEKLNELEKQFYQKHQAHITRLDRTHM
jgi:hypothetical protein